ncbi:uncharacterized protein LOC131019198 [Salvia miltiorrhiza]|uniref:uncharacterized protein LOC131019198 n=1 Tax=Salvia miltiorrhiza TaxID=226208 RepID=UPI0025AD0287|nr:uncharacterized protein LOC131019198 [Salvia miltiorrhiza]
MHVVAAIHFMNHDPVHYVHQYYSVEKYLLGYQCGLEPVRGEKMWPEVSGFKVKPPMILKKAGRPKKKRIRGIAERDPANPNKLKKDGMQMACKNCGGVGHNKRPCKVDRVELPTKEKGKRGQSAKQNPPVAAASTSMGKSRKTPQASEASTIAKERNFAR